MKYVKTILLFLILAVCVDIGFLVSNRPESNNDVVVTLPDVVERVMPGVVHIQCPRWQGSGFIIGEHLIATARHVLEGVEEFKITLHDGTKVKATKAISSKRHDIGFIWVEDSLLGGVELESIKECRLGQRVFAIGSPYGKINQNSVTLGVVSGLNRNYDELNSSSYSNTDYGWGVAFQTDSPGHPGNSGGPIFSLDGKVRGILVGGFSPSLIIAMPVDLFIKDIDIIVLMFNQHGYFHEKVSEEQGEYYNYVEDSEYY